MARCSTICNRKPLDRTAARAYLPICMNMQDQLNRIEAQGLANARDLRNIIRYCSFLPMIYRQELREMTALSDIAAQLAADAQTEKDGFVAVKGILTTQAATIKDLTDKLAALPAGEDTGPIVTQLQAVHESMTGTNADILAAGALANTPAASQVPPDAATASAAAVAAV